MKSKSKYTPGPWTADEYGEQIHARTHTTRTHICNVFSPVPEGPNPGTHRESAYEAERKANARLIASAPDLLAFVAQIVAEQESQGKQGDQAIISAGRRLIAKVEGES